MGSNSNVIVVFESFLVLTRRRFGATDMIDGLVRKDLSEKKLP